MIQHSYDYLQPRSEQYIIFKDGPFLATFSSFRLFYFNVELVDKSLPVLGFKPWISGVRSDRFTNWATTIA